MGKVKETIKKTVKNTKRFFDEHQFVAAFVKGAGLGALIGIPLRIMLQHSYDEAFPELMLKGAELYRDAIATQVPDAYEMIKNEFPDGLELEPVDIIFTPLTGKVDFK